MNNNFYGNVPPLTPPPMAEGGSVENKNINRKLNLILVLLISLIICIVIFGSALILSSKPSETNRSSSENFGAAKVIKEIDEKINTDFLFDKDQKKMDSSAIKAYVAALGDAYTTYYTNEEFDEVKRDSSGKYKGLGLTLHFDNKKNKFLVNSTYKGYGAYKAGLKKGDVILKINDTTVTLENFNKLIQDIKKHEVGDVIKLEVLQNGKVANLEIGVMAIEVPLIEMRLIDEVLYIKIQSFEGKVYSQLVEGLKKIDNKSYKNVILDIRDNPGGELSKVKKVVGEFLPNKLISYLKSKNGDREDIMADGKQRITVPVYLLINSNSASASELLAGAFKDYKRATIIGQTTFGKGIAQSIIPLNAGGALKFTTGEFFTPNGNKIHKEGVKPDYEVAPLKDKDGKVIDKPLKEQPEFKKAMELIKAK